MYISHSAPLKLCVCLDFQLSKPMGAINQLTFDVDLKDQKYACYCWQLITPLVRVGLLLNITKTHIKPSSLLADRKCLAVTQWRCLDPSIDLLISSYVNWLGSCVSTKITNALMLNTASLWLFVTLMGIKVMQQSKHHNHNLHLQHNFKSQNTPWWLQQNGKGFWWSV